jgi:predicted TIM-barrel fold metal-dependent hydrolase
MKFDGGIFVGRNPKTTDSLLTETVNPWAQKFQVSKALACDFKAIFDDMYEGNQRTLELSRQHSELIPLSVVNPLHWDAGSNYFEEQKKAGSAGFIFIPNYQSWNYQQFVFRAAAHSASQTGLPIQCVVTQPSDLYWIEQALAASLSPVLIRQIAGGGYSFTADTIALAKTHRHFYFDVSNSCQNGGIAYIASRIGAERLYLASNAPMNIETSAHLLVQAAPDLTDAQKIQIHSQTLAKIFGVSLPAQVPSLPPLWQAHLKRSKVDTHWHSHGWDLLEPQKGFEASKTYLSHFGEKAVFINAIRSLNYDVTTGNTETFDQLESDPRFFGLVVVDPLKLEESLSLLERFSTHPRFAGIKTIQDYYGFDLDHPAYEKIFKWAEAKNSIVMAHIPGLTRAAEKYPQARFIAAHLTWDRLPRVLNAQGKLPKNVYLDIATSHNSRSATQLKRLVDSVGSDRILYSVDGPLMSPAWTIGKLIDAELSEEVLDKIYWQNALNLFPSLPIQVS